MEIEDVSRISFSTGRPSQQQRYRAVCPRVLGKIVIYAEGVLTAVAEVLSHCAASIRSNVLHRRRSRRGRIDDDRIRHRVVIFEGFANLRDSGFLLADRDVDADQILAFRVDDRVYGNRGFAGLAVADYELALAAANGNHRVDCLQPGQHRLSHRLAIDDARREFLERVEFSAGINRALSINRSCERIDYAADHLLSDRN